MTGTGARRTARRVAVRGRVQGVFFRDSCRSEAERLGVLGWVANQPDGSVSACFEGEPDAVDAMVEWCRSGPPRARVEALDVHQVDPEGHRDFEVR